MLLAKNVKMLYLLFEDLTLRINREFIVLIEITKKA
jgi:hypothetical protein